MNFYDNLIELVVVQGFCALLLHLVLLLSSPATQKHTTYENACEQQHKMIFFGGLFFFSLIFVFWKNVSGRLSLAMAVATFLSVAISTEMFFWKIFHLNSVAEFVFVRRRMRKWEENFLNFYVWCWTRWPWKCHLCQWVTFDGRHFEGCLAGSSLQVLRKSIFRRFSRI